MTAALGFASLVGPLGSANEYNVYVYDRGGTRRLGELGPIGSLTWGRVRDDPSEATLATNGSACEGLSMRDIRSWRHEIVIYRDGVRVWEGPVVHVSEVGYGGGVRITAQDVSVWLHRRILREGYDDSYPNTKSVVARAALIARIALLRDDPNVASYIRTIEHPDDAKQSRVVLPYQKMVLEEIDDLASNSGLDYTVAGRSIIFWDTHRALSRLPRLTGEHFDTPPVVTEYGMDLVTYSAVTNGDGLFGADGGPDPYYGLIETLATAYSESDGPETGLGPTDTDLAEAQAAMLQAQSDYNSYPGLSGTEETNLALYQQERYSPGVLPDRQAELDGLIEPLQERRNTKASLGTISRNKEKAYQDLLDARLFSGDAIASYISNLSSQAQRNRTGRNPSPIEVRVPDGSALSPTTPAHINQLIPGIWIPLFLDGITRKLEQWQKLDRIAVSYTPEDGEKVGITLSPAPRAGMDPDYVPPEEDEN